MLLIYVLINLAVDVLYVYIDLRVDTARPRPDCDGTACNPAPLPLICRNSWTSFLHEL